MVLFINEKKYIVYKKAVQEMGDAEKIYMHWIKKGKGHHLSEGAYV